MMKTKKAAAKRFKLSATGKIKARKANMRHLLASKSSGYRTAKGKAYYVNPANEKTVLQCLPYGL